MNSYLNPGNFGIEDVTVLPGGRPMMIVFPTESTSVHHASVAAGTYPLVVFLHGDRHAPEFSYLCPRDLSQDYKAWGNVVYLLAQCGIVVAVPEVSSTHGDDAADVIDQTISWMHYRWAGRATLWYDAFAAALDPQMLGPAEPDRPDVVGPSQVADVARAAVVPLDEDSVIRVGGIQTPVGLAGHSWGVRGCSLYAARPASRVSALASIAGVVDDDNDAYAALIATSIPTLTMIGLKDDVRHSLNLLWPFLNGPKHQAVVSGTDHFDWFGSYGYIHRCDGRDSGTCPVAGATAAEIVLTFMTKYLMNSWRLPSSLVGPQGGRQPIIGQFEEFAGCGLGVRWNAPVSPGGTVQYGEQRWGNLPDFPGWDAL